jgi:hypothetical protein
MPPPAASMDSDEEDFVPQASNDEEDFDLASIDEEFDFEDPTDEELEVEDAHMMMLKMGINDLGLDWVIDAHFKHHHVSIFNLKFFIY